MSSKASGGGLVFGGRNDYQVVSVYDAAGEWGSSFAAARIGYAARCACELGDHYLAVGDGAGIISERTSVGGAVPDDCLFQSAIGAATAIEAWQRQQAQNAAQSNDSSTNGD